MLNARAKHHFMENFSSTESDESGLSQLAFVISHQAIDIRVIEFGELAVLKGGNLIALGFLVERWTRDGSRISKAWMDMLAKRLFSCSSSGTD